MTRSTVNTERAESGVNVDRGGRERFCVSGVGPVGIIFSVMRSCVLATGSIKAEKEREQRDNDKQNSLTEYSHISPQSAMKHNVQPCLTHHTICAEWTRPSSTSLSSPLLDSAAPAALVVVVVALSACCRAEHRHTVRRDDADRTPNKPFLRTQRENRV